MAKRKTLRPGATGTAGGTRFEVGTGNVFADLGLPKPDERLAKSRLAAEISAIIARNGWKQKEAAARLQTHQPVISALQRGRLSSITYDRLVEWLVLLGRIVEIRVKPARNGEPRVKVAIGAG